MRQSLTDRKIFLWLAASVLLHAAALSLWISYGKYEPGTEQGIYVHLVAASASESSWQADMPDSGDRAARSEPKPENEPVPDSAEAVIPDGNTSGDRAQTAEATGNQAYAAGSMPGDRASVVMPPELRYPINASYPPAARKEGTEGTAVFLLEIDETGKVVDAVLKRSAGSRILDRAARSAVMRGIFSPGTSDGVPVRSYVTVEVEFRLDK